MVVRPYRDSSGSQIAVGINGLMPFKFPVTLLIEEQNKRLQSEPPLRWNYTKELEHTPIRKKYWNKGRLLENLTIDAQKRLGLKEINSPENLGFKEFYINCNYQNNGYGADIITHQSLIEVKVRSGYLTPTDFFKNVRPRYEDLDPYHQMEWVFILYGKVTPETKDLIEKHNIHLILIPFNIRQQPTTTTAYIGERLKETMAVFTLITLDKKLDGALSLLFDGVVVSHSEGDDKSSEFMPSFAGEGEDVSDYSINRRGEHYG